MSYALVIPGALAALLVAVAIRLRVRHNARSAMHSWQRTMDSASTSTATDNVAERLRDLSQPMSASLTPKGAQVARSFAQSTTGSLTTGDGMPSSFFCPTCMVAWPHKPDFRKCVGCGRVLIPNFEHEPLETDIAEEVASEIQGNRLMDEAVVEEFRREMEATLGPSGPSPR